MLRDGMRLCNTLNKIKPGSTKVNNSAVYSFLIRSFKVSPDILNQGKPFLMMENINFFLASAAKDFQLLPHNLFLPLDLLERKNMPKVI